VRYIAAPAEIEASGSAASRALDGAGSVVLELREPGGQARLAVERQHELCGRAIRYAAPSTTRTDRILGSQRRRGGELQAVARDAAERGDQLPGGRSVEQLHVEVLPRLGMPRGRAGVNDIAGLGWKPVGTPR
jgi:hypothetical protein